MRRAALMLISDRTAPLLERWHEETGPSVRGGAVVASAPLDPRAVVRAHLMLLEILTDPALAPTFDALIRHGHLTPPVRETLTASGAADRRFSEYGDYRAVLQDEEIRARIDRVLALP
ncbi:hypothetical protein BCL76_11710 [Streptomyces sp. CG 926]|nr:hypothetical protein BCL76_11710 [Streptomyces sp. CG 926]